MMDMPAALEFDKRGEIIVSSMLAIPEAERDAMIHSGVGRCGRHSRQNTIQLEA